MKSKSKIFTIAATQLDTVWNWDFEYTITNKLEEILSGNFSLFEEFPDYKFNFEGAFRYELIEQYYPDEFELVKQYVELGKWNICGSSYESLNTNIVSPETMFRNVLHGNNYFLEKFNKTSNDIFLPTGNGFSWALPTIANHCKLKGFSTGKLTYDGSYKIPFDIGIWKGVDGSPIYASLDSQFCNEELKKIRKNLVLQDKLKKNINDSDIDITMTYSDCSEITATTIRAEMNENDNKDEEIQIVPTSTTEFFDELDSTEPMKLVSLPFWNNELPVANHGVGSYTSRAYSKRIHRKNEELADMAERASVIAMNVTNTPYPQNELNTAWKRVLAHASSNDISGTAVERAYVRSWNDSIMSANQFSSIYESASAQIIKNLDTSWTRGLAVVVGNSVEYQRTSVVDLTIPNAGFKYVRVLNHKGNEVAAQVNYIDESIMKVSILATVASLGYSVYDLFYTNEPCQIDTGLSVGINLLQNNRFIVQIDKKGDICSIIDNTVTSSKGELLKSPIRFEINKYWGSKEAPAWCLNYDETKSYPWDFAMNGVCTIEESGPVRCTLKVVQKAGNSTFTYYVSLAAQCPWISVYNEIEWQELERTLHNGFSLEVENCYATYDLGLGCIERNVASKKLYNVPAQKWADISDYERKIGVSIFSDSKVGWNMKNESTLRMTVLHSPKTAYRQDSMHNMLDFGLNRYGYAIYPHGGECGISTQINAKFYTQPLAAFITKNHFGVLGPVYQFGSTSNENVLIRAIKKAEKSDEIIVRVNEGANKEAKNVQLFLGLGIASAREVYATEEYKGEARVYKSKLVFDLNPYEVKTFALKLHPCSAASTKKAKPVSLPYNAKFTTEIHNKEKATIPTVDVSIPNQIFPESIKCAGIDFNFADINAEFDGLICDGQEIAVDQDRVFFIAASLYGDKVYDFTVDGITCPVKVQSIKEKVGTWDLYNLAQAANIKTDTLAWVCTHTNGLYTTNVADELYFFMYEFNLNGTRSITLPKDNGLVILAASSIDDQDFVKLRTDLYDRVENRSLPNLHKSTTKQILKQKKFAKPAYQSLHKQNKK